ncbi:MAG: 2'-5' RNA ligase family protein [Candidatus Methylacidiphilales bacterium]|nr:2'-5' RNA ligase family protein [Candidatus Methylacidiphilales bacterium]
MTLPIAIFIEPRGVLLEEIVQRKTMLEKILPGMPYTSHPPHSTLIFGNYGEPDAWLARLRERLKSMACFPLHVKSWVNFENDVLAGGGNTIAYRATASKELLALQVAVAEIVAPFHSVKVGKAPHPLAGREPFATSLRLYGSPFIGAHWIPHFTIGSLKGPTASELALLLTQETPNYTFSVDCISVWKVEGEKHERLHEIALAGKL